MADIKARLPENVAGEFYVDSQCIDCDVCRDVAPDNFKRHVAGGFSFVYQQPIDEAERKLCVEALKACPVDAIGSDG